MAAQLKLSELETQKAPSYDPVWTPLRTRKESPRTAEAIMVPLFKEIGLGLQLARIRVMGKGELPERYWRCASAQVRPGRRAQRVGCQIGHITHGIALSEHN